MDLLNKQILSSLRLPSSSIKNVLKRDNTLQPIDTFKILYRLQGLSEGLDRKFVNIELIVNKVIQGLFDEIKTTKIDQLAAQTCAYMNLIHPHYSMLAARIAVNNLHKETSNTMRGTAQKLYNCKDRNGDKAPLLSEDVYNIILSNSQAIQKVIDYQKDYTYDYFGFKTLERAYLLKVDGIPAQRPQHMLMRVSIGIHKNDLQRAFQTYKLMSDKWFIHATPTLFNAGTTVPQMSSCFLLAMQQDSISGIYNTLMQCAKISKSAGGIGLSISNIRSKDSYIKGTNGVSNGIVPMLRVFNDTARYVDQGGGKRKGSFAIYLQPWHSDIFQFLDLKKNTGKQQNRARDLFYGLWIPDLFMKRVIQDQFWTLMCPNQCKGLVDLWGQNFEKLYEQYEISGKGRKTIRARDLWQAIVDSQIQTGTPYMLYKDSCNRKSNQQNLGTIKSSNLCTEIIQYTSKDQVAVCNLASLSLPRYLINSQKNDTNTTRFDFEKLIENTSIIVRNLNKIIDINYYPVEQARNSNLRHRPIGIGVQGLADVFQRMNIPFQSEAALLLNQQIFQTIYYAAVKQSINIAKIDGPYSTYHGSPASKGFLQFDLWNYKPHSMNFDWDQIKQELRKYGLRNSLLVAPMPTASTSQILGNNQSFEPYTSNIYTRRVLAGQFVCVNTNLVKALIQKDQWTPEVKNKLLASGGSIQQITQISAQIRQLYKTVWQISQKQIINLAIGRSPFIDQSQSLNIHLSDPNYSKMCSMHFYAWQKGLKTGMYYLRSRPAVDPIKFTVDVESLLKNAGQINIKQNINKIQQLDEKKIKITTKQNIQQNEKKEDLSEYDKIKKRVKLNNEEINEVKVCPMRKKGAPIDQECLACGS